MAQNVRRADRLFLQKEPRWPPNLKNDIKNEDEERGGKGTERRAESDLANGSVKFRALWRVSGLLTRIG